MAAANRKGTSLKEFFCLLLTGICVFVLTGWVGFGILDVIGCERLGGAFEGKCGWVAVGYMIEYGIPAALLLSALVGYLVLRWVRRPSHHRPDEP